MFLGILALSILRPYKDGRHQRKVSAVLAWKWSSQIAASDGLRASASVAGLVSPSPGVSWMRAKVYRIDELKYLVVDES